MYLETPLNFTGLGDVVLKMNQIMDDWNMPQSSTQRRYLVKKSDLK